MSKRSVESAVSVVSGVSGVSVPEFFLELNRTIVEKKDMSG